jgi:hypothetical protein
MHTALANGKIGWLSSCVYRCNREVLLCLNLTMLADLEGEGRKRRRHDKQAASEKMECLIVW